MRFAPLLLLLALVVGCRRPVEAVPEAPVGTEVGNRAPFLAGLLPGGDDFELEDRPASSTVVIFYRGAECGLCRVRLEQLQEHLSAYRVSGARVVAVTLDPPDLTRGLAEQMRLDFTLVSVEREVFERWAALHPDRDVAMPATYLVDRSGVIRFAHVGRSAADRISDAGLLTLLETIGDA